MHEEPESTIHAAIYARVSSEDQVQGFSLESQIEACHAYARSHGLVVWQSHVFVDGGISGAILERPALSAMRELVRTQVIKAIIVYDLDRLSRVLWHQCMLIEGWQKEAVQFHTVRQKIEDTPEGQLLRQVMGAFAEMERTKIRERSLRGKAKRREAGLPSGYIAPYGYRWTKVKHASTFEIDEMQAEVVRQMFRWCVEGRTLRWITKQLTLDRHPTNRVSGKKRWKTPGWLWNLSSVARMLRFEGYVGRAYAGKFKMIGGKHVKQPRETWVLLSIPAIIDQETFDAVGERLTMNQQRARRNRKHLYLLSGWTFRCGTCGGSMGGHPQVTSKPGKPTYQYTYYSCNSRWLRLDGNHCRVYINARWIEPRVWAFVERVLTSPKLILEALAIAQEGGAEQRLEAQRRVDRLDQAIVQKDQEDAKLIEAYQGSAMTVEELKRHRHQVAAEKQALMDERWQAQEALSSLGAIPPEPYELDAYVGFVQQHLKAGTVEDQRAVIEKLGLVVTWAPGQPISIRGTVPSATPGMMCAWKTCLADELGLTTYP